MTLPWAVEPEERSEPVAQRKPAPSKPVVPAAADPPVAEPPTEAVVVVVVVVLLSLPQAASSSTPDASSALRPARRMIVTPYPPSGSSLSDVGRPRRTWHTRRLNSTFGTLGGPRERNPHGG